MVWRAEAHPTDPRHFRRFIHNNESLKSERLGQAEHVLISLITQITSQPYQLPLRQPWQSARGQWTSREGWLLCLTAGGLQGYGDCAPLPAAGTETPAAAARALERLPALLQGHSAEEAVKACSQALPATPAVRFAVESALLDRLAQQAGLPLRRYLQPDSRDQVRVNAMLGALSELREAAWQGAVAQGYEVLKLKVGVGTAAREYEQLVALAEQLPAGVHLRLDANAAWDWATATQMLAALRDLPIEAVEEPLAEPHADALARLQARVPFPLALDESLQQGNWLADLQALPVRRLVLKPMVIGGLQATLAIAAAARAAAVEVVLTSVFESAAGLWPSVQLAATLPGKQAHGLATQDWLAVDIGMPPPIEQGWVELPQRSGHGFRPYPVT